MSVSPLTPQYAMTAAIEQMAAALDAAADAAVWPMSDDAVASAVVEHERCAARLAELGTRLVRDADRRGIGAAPGGTGTAGWLRGRLRLRPKEAAGRVRLAAALDGPLTKTRNALAAGAISVDHAQVIAAVIADLPLESQADPEAVKREAEAFLLEQAKIFDPQQLRRLGRHLKHVLNPDGVEKEEKRAVHRRELYITDVGDGTFVLRGRLDAEGAAIVLSALDPLAAPRPAEDGTRDPRSRPRRLADALVELAKSQLDQGELLPATRGARPHVIITAGLDTLMRMKGAPAADTNWGGPVSADTLRRIACDAAVSFVLTGPEGQPLHVGRAHRTVTPAIWNALVTRDGGCTFPTCTRPAAWCDAHHVRSWADGGETSLANSALACGQHHHLVHHGGWQIRIADDSHPEWIPPPWIDPDQKPQRNTHWHLADRVRGWTNDTGAEPDKPPDDTG